MQIHIHLYMHMYVCSKAYSHGGSLGVSQTKVPEFCYKSPLYCLKKT